MIGIHWVKGITAGLALVGALGCQSDASVTASQFDQSCSTADDCVGVEEFHRTGSSCSSGCPVTAINKKALPAFEAARKGAEKGCDDYPIPGCASPGPLACTAGKCGFSGKADASP
ncbi:MAG: hypothetical protein HY902_04195 [Deltaproteobacteria bacterium]|nr:hypothetical protein [Deltaproteobacteria bacterium]